MKSADSLNSVVRFTVYFSILLFVATQCSTYLLAIPLVLFATFMLFKLFPHGAKIDAFTVRKPTQKGAYTEPTNDNPFMNVSQVDIEDNPDRGDAMPVNRSDTKAKMAKASKHLEDIHMDTSDLFDLKFI